MSAEEALELQEEEVEALESIWGIDGIYTADSNTSYQVKIAPIDEDDVDYSDTNSKVFWLLLGVTIPEMYPFEPPVLNLDAFQNNRLSPHRKKHILNFLMEQCSEDMLGMPMMFTIVEALRCDFQEIVYDGELPDEVKKTSSPTAPVLTENEQAEKDSKSAIKERQALTKKQKKKLQLNPDDTEGKGWVDLVSHLSRTGNSN
eukprot:TRINITY_DN9701_c0_g1_i1.p1 TRINITY_DN9701_c0_g1~~TRINITY_DN9701_c0_g1_i1.p1  ORF type:complete len:202 (+),score=59.48 TRINITY_DN9701_c0_g1_i1:134-739(+)